MDDENEPWWETWAGRVLSAATAGALLAFILFYDMPGRGRLWDSLIALMPFASASYGHNHPAPRKVGLMVKEATQDRTMVVLPDKLTAAEPSAEPQPAEPRAPAEPAAVRTPVPHLNTQLRTFSTYEERNRTSAVYVAPAQTPAPDSSEPQPAAAPGAPANVAARAGYGAASRNEVMGRAAGPVYNIKGKAKRR
ncbi:MAG: hypothetical protein PHF00_08250 [Elusimicrobia bacterium]|nr:hypothetical protein [Elusimicrobiota bacterium]